MGGGIMETKSEFGSPCLSDVKYGLISPRLLWDEDVNRFKQLYSPGVFGLTKCYFQKETVDANRGTEHWAFDEYLLPPPPPPPRKSVICDLDFPAEDWTVKAAHPKKVRSLNSFKTYVCRVQRRVHPTFQMSRESKAIVDEIIWELFRLIMNKAAAYVKTKGRKTVGAVDIAVVVKALFPKALGYSAQRHASHAMDRYDSSFGKLRRSRPLSDG